MSEQVQEPDNDVSPSIASRAPQRVGRGVLVAGVVLVAVVGVAVGLVYWKKPVPETGASSEQGRNARGRAEGQGEKAHREEVHLDAANLQRWSITLQEAKLIELKPTFEVPGRVSFSQELVAHVGTPLRGRAVQIHVKVGDRVDKGVPLLVVESPELGEAQSDYLQKRTMAESYGPKVELAKSVYERAKNLLDTSQLVARSDVERREIEYREAQAAEKNARSAFQAAENRLHFLGMTQDAVATLAKSGEAVPRLTIHAPMSGEVIDRPVTFGEIVSPERQSLLVIADLGTLWVLADVPEGRLVEITKGTRARIKFGNQEATIDGTTSNVSAAVNADTRTAEVRVEVRNAQGVLKPGMFVRIEIEMAVGTPNRGAVLAIPDEAIQRVEGQPVVFVPVAGEDNTFTKRVVVIGEPVMGLVPVYSGLKQGERYVATGTFILKAELGKGSAEH
ncbi:MAG: efflux RND transporter periplasmic adaptor subunit [Planctomycetota bacterium]